VFCPGPPPDFHTNFGESCQTIAYNRRLSHPDARCATHGGYASVLDAQFETVRETRAEIITEDSFSEYSAKGKVYLMGSGAIKCKEVLSHPNIEFRDDLIPSAKEMATMSHQRFTNGTFEDLAYFEPYYLKEFILGK